VRPARDGRVRIELGLRLTKATRVRIEIARAIGTRGTRRCPRRGSPGSFDGSFGPAGTFTRGNTATARAASAASAERAASADAVSRRYTLTARLQPALYRVTVRPYTSARTLGRPVHRYLRVLTR
jgi:hypothetical protein